MPIYPTMPLRRLSKALTTLAVSIVLLTSGCASQVTVAGAPVTPPPAPADTTISETPPGSALLHEAALQDLDFEAPLAAIDFQRIVDSGLPIGTCLANPIADGSTPVIEADCEASHRGELFHRAELPADQDYGAEAIDDLCHQAVVPLVEPFGYERAPSGSTVYGNVSGENLACVIGFGFTGSFVTGTVQLANPGYVTGAAGLQLCESDCSTDSSTHLGLQVNHAWALPDGRAAAITIDGTGWVWGTGIDDEPLSLEALTGYSYDFQGTFTSLPDGRALVGTYEGGSYIWDLNSGESTFLPVDTDGDTGVFAQIGLTDGRILIEGFEWTVFESINPEAPSVPLAASAVQGTIDISEMADGRVVAATYGGVVIWDPTGTSLPVTVQDDPEDQLRLNEVVVVDDTRVAAVGTDGYVGGDGFVAVWDMNTGEVERFEGTESIVESVTVLDTGQLAAGDWQGNILIWDLDQPSAPVQILEGHTDTVNSLSVLADGRLLSSSDDGTLRAWVISTG